MKTILSLCLVSFFITSCNTLSYNVRVDAFGNENFATKKNYLLLPSDSTIFEYNLEYQEYTGYIIKVMNSKNYHYVEDPSIANVVIFINYGISDPVSYEKLVTKPVWGQTGVASTTSTGTINVNPYSNNITYSQNTTSNPTYGITGYRSYTRTEMVYYRFLRLEAFDFDHYKLYNEQKMIWQTDVISAGWSDDLRKIFPVLVAASKDYFGGNSGEKIMISLNENDKRIKEVKGIN